jgi:hypothetical protein
MEFKPGFRLSLTDIIILIIGGAVSAYFAVVEVTVSLIVVFVLGHFFLFCNVFRISRPPELIWAAFFICLSILTSTIGYPSWIGTFSLSIILTIVLIFRETRLPSYHGILWHRVNPELEQWWEKNHELKKC